MSREQLRFPPVLVLWLVYCLVYPQGLSTADACSRATWIGHDGSVITGRTMDWPYDFNTHFYVIPRAEKNEGLPGGHSWTSKHRVVVAAGAANPGGPINGVFDGMNEHGPGGNMLYLAETDFGVERAGNKPKISWAAWLQYVLSNFRTVAEAVEGMKDEPVYLVPARFGPGDAGHPTVHLSLSDLSGDSAIMEYLSGKLVIHHGRQFQVMTNSPSYDQQLTLNSYWSRQDGNKFLPGSHASEDRFVRASYYLSKLPETSDSRKQVAGIFSVIRNVSVPWGTIDPGHPNLVPTYWRTVLDHTRKIYYFESALSASIVSVDLKQIDFAPGSSVRNVALEGEAGHQLQGNINSQFKPAPHISYLSPVTK